MKRFLSIIALIIFITFTLTGCQAGDQGSEAQPAETEETTEAETDTEDLLLTENEVKSFIEAHPVFYKITKEKMEELEKAGESKNVFQALRGSKEYEEYVKDVNKALDKYGFNIQSFSNAYQKVMSAYFYMQTQKGREQSKENMKKMLENPNIPKEQKKEIQKSLDDLEEAEESEEVKAIKKNWEIVKKYKEEIENLDKFQ